MKEFYPRLDVLPAAAVLGLLEFQNGPLSAAAPSRAKISRRVGEALERGEIPNPPIA